MNKIKMIDLAFDVLTAMKGRPLKAKSIKEFERYGIRRIMNHFKENEWVFYSKKAVWDFVLQESARMESGQLPAYQWAHTRRAAVYLEQMAEHSKIQEESFEAHLNLSSPSDEIVDNMIRSEDLSYLEKAIGELNEIYRSVLELRYVNEFSNEEIAAFLNLQKRTVETRLYRANLLLKDKVMFNIC